MKGMDECALGCMSRGEFQGITFVKAISEAMFVTNLLCLCRQDKIDLDAVAVARMAMHRLTGIGVLPGSWCPTTVR